MFMMAQAFMEKDAGNGFARLDRYRANLERTYHRCAEAPPPGYEFQPKLFPIDQNGENKAANSVSRGSCQGT